MRTDAQINASRANGAKSRGPVTAAGKRNSSHNSTQHGIFARSLLLCTESRADFDELAQTLYDEFQPETPFEVSLVQNMIAARWRQMRLQVMEQATMNREIHRQSQNPAPETEPDQINAANAAESFRFLSDGSRTLDLMVRYESRMDRQYLRSHKRLLEVQDRRRSSPPPTPAAPVIPIRPEPAPELRQVPTGKTQDRTRQATENEQPVTAAAPFPQVFICPPVSICVTRRSSAAQTTPEPSAAPSTPDKHCVAAPAEQEFRSVSR
ncbi:MAG TPA: hypothetical protein VG297_01460 [Bryobacteraceae bacterium]|jgi:hypothetical protein|nr:hypothetical protein [Bryobacteraceae bacterium]